MIRRTAACALATLATGTVLALLPAQSAQAHPLGNFTVNQYDGLVVVPGKLSVDHVEDLAEIPASQERNRIDTDRDNRLAPDELSAWARARCGAAAEGARLTVGGEGAGGTGVSVSVRSTKAQVRAGQAGLQTLRVTCEMTAPLPDDARLRLAYRPADVATGAGWREITARGDRMTVSGAGVPDTSRSRRLTAYPDDLLSSPPDSRSAAFTVRPGGSALRAGSADEETGPPALGVLPRGTDRWTQALTGLVARHELTVGFAALALGASLLLGAMHALAPGHGKTMMAAAAAAGGRSSLRDMLALGASVTLTHTLGVFALGALITAALAAAPTVVSWLGIASGTLVAVAGGFCCAGGGVCAIALTATVITTGMSAPTHTSTVRTPEPGTAKSGFPLSLLCAGTSTAAEPRPAPTRRRVPARCTATITAMRMTMAIPTATYRPPPVCAA